MTRPKRADMAAYEGLADAVRRGDLTTDEARDLLDNQRPAAILRALDELRTVEAP